MVFDSPCATNFNNMNEVQIKIAELKIEYAEQKLTDDIDANPIGYGYLDEEELFDRIIEVMQERGVIHNQTGFVLHVMGKSQRQRFFDRVGLVMAYDMDGMSEREFILNTKLLIYNI